MTAKSATERAQRQALSMMTDACTVGRVGTTRVYNPATDSYNVVTTTVYSGVCRVKPAGSDTVSNVGEQTVSRWPYTVSLPVTATPAVDDQVTVTASGDPALTGLKLRVRSVVKGTNVSARRLGCEERE